MAALDMAGGVAGSDALGSSAGGSPGSGRERPQRDSTVLTIAELDFDAGDPFSGEPQVKVVEHVQWTGVSLAAVYPQLVDLLKRVWNCRRVVVDATGLGQGPASFLERALGKAVVDPFVFTAQSKSRLGFDLLAAVNSGRLKMYAPDGSPEYVEFWEQLAQAEAYFRPNRTMNFHVDPQTRPRRLPGEPCPAGASPLGTLPGWLAATAGTRSGKWRSPPCADAGKGVIARNRSNPVAGIHAMS